MLKYINLVLLVLVILAAARCSQSSGSGATGADGLTVQNISSQCPEIDGQFANEKERNSNKDIRLDKSESPPVLIEDNSRYIVDGASHKLDDTEDYQAGCQDGAVIVQTSSNGIKVSRSEYRVDNGKVVITRKSLNGGVTIPGPEQTSWKHK